MQTCFEIPGGPYARISLEQSTEARKIAADESFRVTYGMQVKDGLSYADAARELGECTMHRAACDGMLDNETGE